MNNRITHILRVAAICAVATAIFAGSAMAGDGVYKWTDKQGRVHYSDSPPPDAKVLKLKDTRAPAPSAPNEGATEKAPRTIADQELESRQRRASAEEAAKESQKKSEQAEAVKQACNESRGRLTSLNEGGRMYKRNDKGDKVFFDDKMRAQEIAKEKQFLDKNCKA